MKAKIQTISEKDYPNLIAINNKIHPPHIAIDYQFLETYIPQSTYYKKITLKEKAIGFVFTLPSRAKYLSLNYLWFSERYSEFIYIDRVGFLPEFQSKGFGSLLYSDLTQFSDKNKTPLTCEVSCNPPNTASLNFHSKFSFTKVGNRRESKTCELAMLFRPAF